MNKIIIDSSPEFTNLKPRVAKIIQKSLKILKKNNLAMEIYLVKDAEIKRLNKHFLGKNKVTSVLSFEALPEFPRPDIHPLRYLGEIYLAPDYIKNHKEDIRRLARHGLLHLLGYTHHKKGDRIRMERLEQKLQTFNS